MWLLSYTFFLVYDFALCQFVITIIYVAAWIGTWQNWDSLFDQIIFQGNMAHSNVASLAIGAFVSTLIVLFQIQIRTLAKGGGL